MPKFNRKDVRVVAIIALAIAALLGYLRFGVALWTPKEKFETKAEKQRKLQARLTAPKDVRPPPEVLKALSAPPNSTEQAPEYTLERLTVPAKVINN